MEHRAGGTVVETWVIFTISVYAVVMLDRHSFYESIVKLLQFIRIKQIKLTGTDSQESR